MPFLPQNSFLSEEDKRKQLEQNNSNMVSGESGNTFTVGLPSENGNNSGPKKSGSFTNLNKYLDANVEQSNQLGTDVSNKITGLGTEARNQFGASKDQFVNKVNSGTINNLDTALTDAQGVVNKATSKKSTDTFEDSELNRYKDVTNAQYQGPNKIEDESDDYNPALQLKDKVTNYADLSKTDEGRANLLTDIYKRPNYSQGQVTFDNLLLGGNEQSREKLDQARNNVADVRGLFDSTIADSNKYVQDIKGQTDSVRNASQQYTTENQVGRNNDVQGRLDDVQSKWNDEYNEYVNLLNNSNGGKDLLLNDVQMEKLNLKNYQRIFNMLKDTDAQNYLRQNQFDAQKNISKDEQAQLSALDMLANQYGGNQINRYKDASIAETQSVADAFDGTGFGDEAKIRTDLFNQYAADTNLTGTGQNTQSYNHGPFGSMKDYLTRDVSFTQNLGEMLKTIGYGSKDEETNSGDMSISGMMTSLVNNWLGGVTDGRGDLWRDGSNEASRAAGAYAAEQAKASLFTQILAALETQGFDNKVNGSIQPPKFDPKNIPIKGR